MRARHKADEKPRGRSPWRVALLSFGVIVGAGLVLTTLLAFVQGRHTPTGQPTYVALGSSYAAGAGLGPLQAGSPLLCARSINGYPQQVAKALGVPIVDMTCGGAVTRNLFAGGQFFQGPQVRVVTRETRLVTVTVGGNDIGYVGDLSLLAARNSDGAFGWLVRRLWPGPKPLDARDYGGFRRDLTATIAAIRARAPDARIVIVTYPAILPASGTCDVVNLTAAEAAAMRAVGDRLAATTRQVARSGGADLVDVSSPAGDHDACSADPWVTGWKEAGAAPFHPTRRGAVAVAEEVVRAATVESLR